MKWRTVNRSLVVISVALTGFTLQQVTETIIFLSPPDSLFLNKLSDTYQMVKHALNVIALVLAVHPIEP